MMKRKFLYIILMSIFSIALISNAIGSARLYISPPGQNYYSRLAVGDTFTLKIIAEADAPGVTMFSFSVNWSPVSSVDFVHPINGGSLTMLGFFPPTSFDSSRLSGVMPDSTSENSVGGSGSTPDMAVFTAPALNSTGPAPLAGITFRKMSSSYPVFSISGTAYNSLGNPVSLIYTGGSYAEVDIGAAEMSGAMLSGADGVIVSINGVDYQANASGDSWTVDVSSTPPDQNSPRSIVVSAMQGNSVINSFTIEDFVVSPGWYGNSANHSENPADCNGDGVTNSTDLFIMAPAYGSSAGDDGYDFRCDFNSDGAVNLTDLLIFGLNY